MVAVNGVDTERALPLEGMEDAERDGPSFDATSAVLSKNRLYSYFAEVRGQTGDGSHTCDPVTHIGYTVPTRYLSLRP